MFLINFVIMQKPLRTPFVICLFVLALRIPLYAQQDIASARSQGSGATVTVSGIITNGEELGIIRYMQDQTGGIAIYSSEMNQVQRGDSVTVTGTLKDYNSLLEMDPVTSVVIHSMGHTLPEPVVLTPGEFSETYEGMLVQVDQAIFSSTGVFQRTAYSFISGAETGQVYINSPGSPLIGTPIPSSPVTLIGPLGSYLGTYQVLPRDLDDLTSYSSIHILNTPVISGLSQTGFTMEWDTDVAGTTEAFAGLTPELELPPVKVSGSSTHHTIVVEGRSPAELYYLRPFSVLNEDTAKAALQVAITQSQSSGTMRTLFNRPVDESVSLGLMEAEYLPEGIDEEVIMYINQAEESIDLALYNLNNSGISDITGALNQAYQRGVVVRAIYDGDVNATGMQNLDPAIGKISSPPSDYPYYGIMHNKFLVIDAESGDPLKPLVWTGSTNFTYSQVNTDPNNVIVIQDQSLARAYRLEFNEMFGSAGPQPDPEEARFGPDKSDNTPHEFIIGGKRVECYFSPSDGTHQQILNTLLTAGHSVHVSTMLITKEDIGNVLVQKSNEGNQVQVLLNDYDQYGEPILNMLKASLGEDVRLTGEPGIMHHKYLIVDQDVAESDPLVLTGSHNWSSSAQLRNDENTLVIHDQGAANAYYEEFVSRFSAGKILVSDGSSGEGPADDDPVGLYPNPATDRIYLRPSEGTRVAAIFLRDVSGREWLRYVDPVPWEIDVGAIQPGIYLVQIRLADGTILNRKILIH